MACGSSAAVVVGGRGFGDFALRSSASELQKVPLSLRVTSSLGTSSDAESGKFSGLRRSLRWGASAATGNASNLWTQPPSHQFQRCSASRLVSVVAEGHMERSYIMIKPDGVHRGLVGEIISRFERKGFILKGLKLFQTPQELAEEHYSELKEKPFFPNLVKYIVSGPVVSMVWEGPGVVASARKLIGATNPLNAEPGTIRGDFGVNTGRNVIHGSDSPANGEREIALWFKEGEVINWEPVLTPWILE